MRPMWSNPKFSLLFPAILFLNYKLEGVRTRCSQVLMRIQWRHSPRYIKNAKDMGVCVELSLAQDQKIPARLNR